MQPLAGYGLAEVSLDETRMDVARIERSREDPLFDVLPDNSPVGGAVQHSLYTELHDGRRLTALSYDIFGLGI